MVVDIETHPALLPVGFILHPTTGGITFATNALMSWHDLPDLISIGTHNDPHMRMLKYDSNCTFRTNWLNLGGNPCCVSEPELLNAFETYCENTRRKLQRRTSRSLFLGIV